MAYAVVASVASRRVVATAVRNVYMGLERSCLIRSLRRRPSVSTSTKRAGAFTLDSLPPVLVMIEALWLVGKFG